MSKATILIVEDEAIVAADLASKLARLGYGINGTTEFAEEAVKHAQEQRPDLILMDIRLAGAMDGIDAAEIIRRELDLPVIYLTAHSDLATLERAKLTKPFGYVLKPFEERELATNIEMALYKHQAERRLRQAYDELELRVQERTRELRVAERELREMNETLEQRVAERTAELESANALLRNSRMAALNMMEDAVTARRQTEEASAERERVKERLMAQARTLKALNSSSHALLHATDELSLLQAVCRTVVEDCGHAMVWIGYAEEDGEKNVRPVASAGFEEGYLETLKITWADTERGLGPTGTAIRTGKPCGCADMLSDPAFEPWRDEAVKRGYASSMVLPLMYDGKALGALSIYSPKAHAFSEGEVGLLMQLADELAYGISTLRLRDAHDQSEKELRHNESILAQAGQMANLGAWEIEISNFEDFDANPLRWSDEVYRIFGYRPDEVEVTNALFFERTHPNDRQKIMEAVARAVELKQPYSIEHRIIRPDGSERTVYEHAEITFDDLGRPVHFLGAVQDITERKRYEEDLQKSKEEWELTFNSVPDLIAILNDRHQVVRVNKAMAERLGRKPEECVGISCYEAIHGSSLPPEFCPHSRTMNDGGEHTVELYAEQLEANYLVSTTPLFDLQGQMTGTVHVARDITERKRAEEELRRAKEAAEAATRAKSQFLANMSHELRTPMSGVIGMLDLALSGNLEAEQMEFIEVARSSASSLVRILNDILDLTKIEAGKFSLEEKPFSLRKCVEETVSLLLPSALSKGLDLNFTVAGDVPEILVTDHLRLSQVLMNLAGNAVKFTEKGKVEINVTAGGSAPDGKKEVTFAVVDTGIGIPDDKKHLLFQVFSQVDDSHTRIYGGTGLGLSISKEIVERMGGTMTFSSNEGKGSTFSCTIPFAVGEAERADIAVSQETATQGNIPCAAEGAKPRLLIAEDDATIRQVLGLMLQRSNFEIEFAESGVEAVEIWAKGEFDLILMDVQMPGMNGFEATAVIREKERGRGCHTPIIAMTAHALKEDEERCFAAGMDSYISKPIDFKKSLQMIKEMIGNNGTCS